MKQPYEEEFFETNGLKAAQRFNNELRKRLSEGWERVWTQANDMPGNNAYDPTFSIYAIFRRPVTYCSEPGCNARATTERPYAGLGPLPVTEPCCEAHALEAEAAHNCCMDGCREPGTYPAGLADDPWTDWYCPFHFGELRTAQAGAEMAATHA